LSEFRDDKDFGVEFEIKKRRAAAELKINEEWYRCGSPLLSLYVLTIYLSSRCEARDLHLPSTISLFADVMKD
jgi:hypothetical protein